MTNEAVVAYDIMWEAANRLQGLYVQEVRDGGISDLAISKMRALVAEVEAVDIDDLDAQRAETERLGRAYAERAG